MLTLIVGNKYRFKSRLQHSVRPTTLIYVGYGVSMPNNYTFKLPGNNHAHYVEPEKYLENIPEGEMENSGRLLLVYNSGDSQVVYPVLYENKLSLTADFMRNAREAATSNEDYFTFLGEVFETANFCVKDPSTRILTIVRPLVITVEEFYNKALRGVTAESAAKSAVEV